MCVGGGGGGIKDYLLTIIITKPTRQFSFREMIQPSTLSLGSNTEKTLPF